MVGTRKGRHQLHEVVGEAGLRRLPLLYFLFACHSWQLISAGIMRPAMLVVPFFGRPGSQCTKFPTLRLGVAASMCQWRTGAPENAVSH